LAPYAASANFVDAMKVASIPHPFDSHPATPERMKNVDYPVDERAYGEIVSGEPAHSWVDDIQTATEIEQSLWDTYERRFAVMHERSLAYRYEPGNHAELAIVLKYFPQVTFQLKNGSALHINYAGLDLPEQKTSIAWDKVVDLKYRDGISGDVLEIVHPEKGLIGAKTTKVKLPGIRKDRQRCKAVLAHYWQRHQIMREQNAMVSV